MTTDPAALTAALVRCPSVTPAEGGALDLLRSLLEPAGFACTRIDRNGTPNLFARWGRPGTGRSFGFNGHTDVVPAGDREAWTADPFGSLEADGMIWGRGAVDMKSGVAAFVAAAIDFVRERPPAGSIVVTVTGDEEGPATDGTVAILDWMAAEGERMDHCLVGEPTCPERLGEMMKIGRRGAMNVRATATGVQGHAAYPHRARNPLPVLVRFLDRIAARSFPATAHFEPTTLALTTIDTGNPATNVIPARAGAGFDIRFNDAESSDGLAAWLREEAAAAAAGSGVTIDLAIRVSGESFLTPPGPFSDLVAAAVEAETGLRPVASTSGGTSDARFIRAHCPVVEFGLVGRGMHAVDERVPVADIHRLKAIYTRILAAYFA
jgi:succinyl-diaminopimelate desuccinylase